MKKLLAVVALAASTGALACPTCPSSQDYLDLVRSHGLLEPHAFVTEGSALYLASFEALAALPAGGENTIHSGLLRLYATSDPAAEGELSLFAFSFGYSSDYFYRYGASAWPSAEASLYEIAYAERAGPLAAVVSAAPEPSTYALMLLGLAALVGRRLRAS